MKLKMMMIPCCLVISKDKDLRPICFELQQILNCTGINLYFKHQDYDLIQFASVTIFDAQIKLILSQMAEPYNFSNLQESFKSILKDKKRAALNSLQLILQLNKEVGFDEILVREGLQSYQQKSQLQKNKIYKNYEKFFKYMLQQLDSIEQNYLRQTNDKEMIEKAHSQNANEYNYLLNKNNISKFVRDQAPHYQKILDEYLQETANQQKGIKSTKMHLFFIKLFNSQYISIVKSNQLLSKSSNQQMSIYIGNHLLKYSQSTKDMTSSQAFAQFSINQEEILDFLTFWLKQEAQNGLFVLYARTKRRLDQESKILLNKSVVKAEIHPSRMTKMEMQKIEKNQEEKSMPQMLNNSVIAQQQQKQQEKQQKFSKQASFKVENNINTIDLSRSNEQENIVSSKIQIIRSQQSKQEISQKDLKNLFEFGCKRRYKLNKNTTFQELQNQMKTMDLQKFINFCNFFQISSINKQLLVQYFKIHAVNMRTIDFNRFQQIIKKIIKSDSKIIDNLLNKGKYQNKSRLNQIRRSKKTESKPSSYQFKLLPVNGKDVSTIEKELYYRKLQKQIQKEEKDQRAHLKRQQLQNPKLGNLRSKSIISHQRISTIDLESIRDSTFNPQKLLHESPGDHLWNVYQAKIWKKEEKAQKSAIQLLLSKRMNKGASIINKINSERSFLTE